MVTFGSSFNVRELRWEMFREELASRGGSIQFDQDDDAYQIYFTDASEIFNCVIYKNLVPDTIATSYSQGQNDSDKNEFVGHIIDSVRPAQLTFATADPALFDSFSRVSVTTADFNDMAIDLAFIATSILLSLEDIVSGDIIEYSFDGVNVHGDMKGRSNSEAISYDNRFRSKIWLRRNASSPSESISVRVEAWR